MLYEDQALEFDERAGLPADAAEVITRALVDLTGLAPGDTLLEIGAGTGMLSLPILRRAIHYIGFDRSPAMLAVFRQRLAHEGYEGELLVSDGNLRWPADDRSVSVILSVRALHHIDPLHAVAETGRVLRPEGGWLVLGRVRRPGDSLKAILRRRMRRILGEHGIDGRSHESHAESVFTALEEIGGRPVAPVIAARWTRPHRPADSFTSWEGKVGLAGIDVPAGLKAQVLAELRAWAVEEYGDLDLPIAQEEYFELSAIDVRRG